MARPTKARTLEEVPKAALFIPAGWTQARLPSAEVAIEDFEMMRLVDGHAFSLKEAAERMGVSKSTGGRMLECARRAIALGLERRRPLLLDASPKSSLAPPQTPGAPSSDAPGLLALTTQEASAETTISRIFGRAAYFAVCQPEAPAGFRFLNNPGALAGRGSALRATETLRSAGVRRVVAGRYGSEALEALGKAGIEPLIATGLRLRQAIDLFSKP